MTDTLNTPTLHNDVTSLQQELTCSICTEILFQPLTLLDCLHTFCGACLKRWFQTNQQRLLTSPTPFFPYICPACRSEVRDTKLNTTLTAILEVFLRFNSQYVKSDMEKQEIAKFYTLHEQLVPRNSYQPILFDPTDQLVSHDTATSTSDEVDDEYRRLIHQIHELELASSSVSSHDNESESSYSTPRGNFSQLSNSSPHRTLSGEQNQTPPEQSRRSYIFHWRRRSTSSTSGTSTSNHQYTPDLHSCELSEQIMQIINEEGMLDGQNVEDWAGREEELVDLVAQACNRRLRQQYETASNGGDTRRMRRFSDLNNSLHSWLSQHTSSSILHGSSTLNVISSRCWNLWNSNRLFSHRTGSSRRTSSTYSGDSNLSDHQTTNITQPSCANDGIDSRGTPEHFDRSTTNPLGSYCFNRSTPPNVIALDTPVHYACRDSTEGLTRLRRQHRQR